MKQVVILFAIITVLLAGCTVERFADRHTPSDVQAEVDALNMAVMSKDFDRVFSNVAPEIKSEITDEITTELKSYVRGGVIGDPKLKVFNKNAQKLPSGYTNSSYHFIYEIETDEGFQNLEYQLIDRGKGIEIAGLNINYTDESPSKPYRLLSAEITGKHLVMVVAMLAVLAFIVYNLLLCFRSGAGWVKWLWAVLIIIGTHGLLFNWMTGEFQNTYMRYWSAADGSYGYIKQTWFINLFGISATKTGGYSPWMMGAYLPIGAILFWLIKGRKIRRSIIARRSSAGG